MLDNLRLLPRLFARPHAAMSAILDEGSLLFACVAVIAVSVLLQAGVDSAVRRFWPAPTPVARLHPDAEIEMPEPGPRWSHGFRFYTPLLILAVFYVPGTLAAACAVLRWGGFWTVFAREYAPLLTCVATAWAAVHLPLAAVVLAPLPFAAIAAVWVAGYLYFFVLVLLALRVVAGASTAPAAATVAVSWIFLVAGVYLQRQFGFILGYLASPFFLFFAYRYLSGEVTMLGAGLRQRQSFRRFLDAATVNPHDAEAQYQLGLVYQHRRQYPEALARFREAVRIDRTETDAHFQLGRIARQQGRFSDALAHFETVFQQNPKHSTSEILRELAATYLDLDRAADARRELETYIERRPYDPEGLCYRGLALEKLGDTAGACDSFRRAVEAARTAPRFRRRLTDPWGRRAQKQLGKLPRS
ncbi:MAG: tetratricopeptide repeat protein [Bryobacteraceae bacterium]